MKIGCPSCDEVLDLAGFRIPAEGRLLACPVCEHMWKARPTEVISTDLQVDLPDLGLPPPEEERPAPVPASRQRGKKRRWAPLLAFAIVLLAGLGGGAAFYLRPASAPVVDVPLKVSSPQFSGRAEDGILTIAFEVENNSSFAKPLARACIALRGKDELELFAWCERMAEEIPAGGRHNAQLRLANPPAGVLAVAINVN